MEHWTICRLIGLLNMIYFGLGAIYLIMKVVEWIVYVMQKGTDKEVGHQDHHYHSYSFMDSIVHIILLVILIIVFIVLFIVNYEITPASPPSGGTIKKWLLYHKLLFILYIILIITSIVYGYTYYYGGFMLLILLAIEIFIVYKYNGETPGGIIGVEL